MIQINNVPQNFAYQITPESEDEEPLDWAINTDGGEAIANLLISPIRYYDITVRLYVVRRRALP
jgi:hypothetical protein